MATGGTASHRSNLIGSVRVGYSETISRHAQRTNHKRQWIQVFRVP